MLGDCPRHQPGALDVLNEGAEILRANRAAFRRAGGLLDRSEVAGEKARAAITPAAIARAFPIRPETDVGFTGRR